MDESSVGLNPRVVALTTRQEAQELLAEVGPSPAGMEILVGKAYTRAVKLHGVGLKAAIIMKQEMIAAGGDAAVSRAVADLSAEVSDVVLLGSPAHFASALATLRRQPFGLKDAADQVELALRRYERLTAGGRVWRCGRLDLEVGSRTLVMGILNVTPDSFSDGGAYMSHPAAVRRAHELAAAGADIIDVGGESTRPGAAPVSEEEECARILPVLEAIVGELPVAVSVDTSKAGVARRALEMAAHIVNDVTAFSDPSMPGVVRDYGAGAVLMHMQGDPRTMQVAPSYDCLVSDILGFLRRRVEFAMSSGVGEAQLAVDPGIGFGKTVEHNLQLLRNLAEFRSLGLPIVIGTSRKSFIGKVLGLPPDERVLGTAATVALAIAGGADVVRVHDVREMAQVVRMADAVIRKGTADG